MLMQLAKETIKAVPTPRFDVGEKTLAAQLLLQKVRSEEIHVKQTKKKKTYMTRGNKL